jgi:phosphate transport system substrate-binding protein
MSWEGLLAFERIFNYDPLAITGMTGWAVNPPFAIVVNRANPIEGVTMAQLDGIFGAERTGGWVGTTWHPEFARGPEGNIRTWGQAGLTGDWKDKAINVYSYALRCMFGPRFSDDVLKGSDQWNERLRQYFSIARPDGTLLGMDQQMANDLAADPCGIAFFSSLRGLSPKIKAIGVATKEGGPYVRLTLQSTRDHTYPLYDRMFFYINRKPGTPLDPKVKEFMTYILSREGQEAVARDGKMLPLTAELIRQERQKLQ